MNADPLALHAAGAAGDAQYDPTHDLLRLPATPNPIHTRIVSGTGLRIRASLAYVLTLLELDRAGDRTVDGEPRVDRAIRVLDRVLGLQDVDPHSATYGLWSYWAEEPLSEMVPPDWNWADFLGEFLSLIVLRHGDALTVDQRSRAEAALGHAARSIIRRNVDLDYTNIAVKGAFVTAAVGTILDDAELRDYGIARIRRLADNLRETRSFAEYNSPTYWQVVLQSLTAMRQYLPGSGLGALVTEMERVVWEHFVARWHPPTGQLTGPMARCYQTDLHNRPGPLLVVQRVAGDTWTFFDETTLPPDIHYIHDAVLDYRMPEDLRPALDQLAGSSTVRETFTATHYIPGQVAGISAAGAAGHPFVVLPTVGTSWRADAVTLGSVNHGDTWVQRRPLLGYWAEPGDSPTHSAARSVSVEVLRDGHGFAGGSFSSAQQGGDVLWAISLASPSGDEHIHLDAIAAGQPVPTSSLSVRFSIRGADAASIRIDGEPVTAHAVVAHARSVDVRSPALALEWRLADARFDGEERRARVTIDAGAIDIDVPLWESTAPRDLVVSDLGPTFVAGLLRMSADTLLGTTLTARVVDDAIHLARRTVGRAELTLLAPALPGSRLDHARIAARDPQNAALQSA